MPGYFHCIFTMSFHANAQGFQALQDQKRIVRRDCGAGVPERHNTTASDVGCGPERFGVNNAVIGRVGLIQFRESFLVGYPVKFSGINNDAANGVSVPANVFR